MDEQKAKFYWGDSPDTETLKNFVAKQQHQSRNQWDEGRYQAALFILRQRGELQKPAPAAAQAGAAAPAQNATPAQGATQAQGTAQGGIPGLSLPTKSLLPQAEDLLAFLITIGVNNAGLYGIAQQLGVTPQQMQVAASKAQVIQQLVAQINSLTAPAPLPGLAGPLIPPAAPTATATSPGAAAPAAAAPAAPKLRQRPAGMPLFTEASAQFYWNGASLAEMQAFVDANLDTQLSAFDERRYFAAVFLLAKATEAQSAAP